MQVNKTHRDIIASQQNHFIKRKSNYSSVGIDEAGRGPLAGPVLLSAVAFFGKSKCNLFWQAVGDSKKIRESERERLYKEAKMMKKRGEIDFTIASISSRKIDSIGIEGAINLGVKRCLARLSMNPNKTRILLDGRLRAPHEYILQRTIVRGDEKFKLIGLASIIAKVERDKIMTRYSKRFPIYGFHENKGYGTSKHVNILRKYGPSEIHRNTFLKKIF